MRPSTYGTLVSPTMAGRAGTSSGCMSGSVALVQSHAEPATAMPPTATFAATATRTRNRLTKA